MASETTAAATGAVGVVRHPMYASVLRIPYGDYFQHWIDMGEKLGDRLRRSFNVNWFKNLDEGHFIWPGFGDNLRVLEWIVDRCKGEADAVETAIGYVPKAEDINIEGLDLDRPRRSSHSGSQERPVGKRSRRHRRVLQEIWRQASKGTANSSNCSKEERAGINANSRTQTGGEKFLPVFNVEKKMLGGADWIDKAQEVE